MKTSKEVKKIYSAYKKNKMTGSIILSLKQFVRDHVSNNGKHKDLFEQWLLNKAVG